MQYYKDAVDGFYVMESDAVAPSDWQELTEAEWLSSNPQAADDPKSAIRAQIKQLESEQLMPRATREFMLLFMEANFTSVQLDANPGYQAVKAFDNQIKDLRAQL